MTPDSGAESEYFRNYSGNLSQRLEFEMLDDGLLIRLLGQPNSIRYKHSYLDHHFFKRAQQSRQGLVKACNNKQRNISTVLDLTGGWGMDSFILACHGHIVTTIEQNELVHMISAYSLKCARAMKKSAMAANRIEMIRGNSLDYLNNPVNLGRFDCIYLDPMFPEHKSSAKSTGGLQILQMLSENLDIQACFELALAQASKRVVVKSPAKSAILFDHKPNLVWREKTVRFDIYLTA